MTNRNKIFLLAGIGAAIYFLRRPTVSAAQSQLGKQALAFKEASRSALAVSDKAIRTAGAINAATRTQVAYVEERGRLQLQQFNSGYGGRLPNPSNRFGPNAGQALLERVTRQLR